MVYYISMALLSLLSSLCIGILSLFLAGSASAERLVQNLLTELGYAPTIQLQVDILPTQDTEEPISDTTMELSVLPSVFEGQEYGGPIPDILLTTPRTQEASIILAASSSEASENTDESPLPTSTVSVRDALVNIFCTLRIKDEVRATTGSGVFIHERGVILTNAHVAQFLLLAEPARGITTSCTVRAGSPATPKYYADLLYIPPHWVQENAEELHSEQPSGTGERDYALLYVVSAIEGDMPSSFPALTPLVRPLTNSAKHEAVLAAGFPAEIVKTAGSKAALNATIATTTITELFTYTKNKVDLIGIAPSAVGEQGSSGGPITTLEGGVIGIIATKGSAEKDGAKSLRALTLAYIDRTIREETKVGLEETISSNLKERARIFRDIMTPILSGMVIDALKQE
jgi:Trypsin-like peptidase domain